ncbi:MAG: shikimate dehydrogenase [Bacteroidaceae bacterium]|nr:shikimate dehydrogenase [Bacteroidaceae bacterium]
MFTIFLILAGVLLIFTKTVNKALNNPDDPAFDHQDTASAPGKEKDPDFEPLPTADEEPVFEPVKKEPEFEPVDEQPKPETTPADKDYSTYGHLFGLIGKPLAHSTSKVRFNKMFREQHINAYYENFELDSIEQVKELIENNPNLCGFNVTIPYKQVIIPYLNRLDETAQAIGAVNTVKVLHRDGGVELVGYNTDWIGFCKSFGELLKGHNKALILGTGGVSKAVKYALDSLGIENKFVSRNSTFDILGYYELSPSVMDEYDVIVNCTPMGMWPDTEQCPDIPYTFLSDRHLLLDVIANPDETLFMKKGRDHGATAKGGKDMLEQQAVAAWEIWNRIGE